MATINQLIRQGRERAEEKSKSPLLNGCPQKRGVCLNVTTTSPKAQLGFAQDCENPPHQR